MLLTITYYFFYTIWTYGFSHIWPTSIFGYSVSDFLVSMAWLHDQFYPVISLFNQFFPIDTLFTCFMIMLNVFIIVWIIQTARFLISLGTGRGK